MSDRSHSSPDARRVALFSASEIGGVGKVLRCLAEGLLRHGHRVDILVPRLRRGLQHIPEGARAIELTRWLPAGSVLPAHYVAVPALARYLRRERPTVLLSATAPLNIAAVLARHISRSEVRLVISQHSPLSETIGSRQYRSAAIMKFLVKRTYPYADAIVTVSRSVADDLRLNVGLNCSNVCTIYNPALTDSAGRLMHVQPEHVWLTNKTGPVVLAVGRLSRQKGFDDLVRAFSMVRSNCNARLLILGSGCERVRLLQLVRELGLEGSVDLPGFAENPYAHMFRADLLVLSSRYEGFGMVLVEALACGCPIVSTDCPGGPREVLDNGRFGHLVPVGDTEALAQAICQTLDQPPDPEPLRRRAMDFHVDKAVQEYRSVMGV